MNITKLNIKQHPAYFSLQFVDEFLNLQTNYHYTKIEPYIQKIANQLDLNEGFSIVELLKQEPKSIEIDNKINHMNYLNQIYGDDKLYNYQEVLTHQNYQPLSWQHGLEASEKIVL